MRVEINSKNDNELYAKRWRQINEALEKAGINTFTINSLADYFSHIEEISQLEDAGRFLLMPLDEEPIYFDTNTRRLQIPNHFTRNGISVQGDHFAELVIFKVPRYFDVHDLGFSKTIYINWEFTPTDKEINSTKGVDPVQYVDTTLNPDYVFFGWYITNEITATKGTLKFSVVFVSDDSLINNTVLSKTQGGFRLNSAPATLNIVEGLDYGKLEPNAQQSQLDVLQNILVNSIYTTPDELPSLLKPIILAMSTLNKKAYTNIDYDNGESDSIELTVEAFSESMQSNESAEINYQWNISGSTIDYKEIEDGAEYSETLNYYIFNEDENAYEKYPCDQTEYETYLATEGNKLYTQYSYIEVTDPGTYSCVVSTSGTHVINGNLTKYYSLPVNLSTTILPAGKPEINWDIDSMDENYIVRNNDNITLYSDATHPIRITGQVKGITIQKADGPQTMNLFPTQGTDEEAMDFLGKITYGIIDFNDNTKFKTGKIQEKIHDKTACVLELTDADFTDEAELKLGAKHRKNNGEWNEGAIVPNENSVFICYHMPTNISSGKIKIKTPNGDTTDLGLESDDNNPITLSIKNTPDESAGETTEDYYWPTVEYGTLSYDWQYKKGRSGEFVSFDNSINGNNQLTINRNTFPAAKAGITDYYYLRVIVTNTNGDKAYTCTSANESDGFRLMIIGPEA